MPHTARGLLAAVLLAATPAVALAQHTIKEGKSAPPAEVPEAVRKLLEERSVQLLDGKSNVLCELWFRKDAPGKATPQQVKNGLTYREVPETTLLAVVKIVEPMTDYRKQRIKAGVYTLRLGFQPQDGDHMGTAPHAEFCLAVPAASDKGAATMEPKDLHELATKASGTAHPAVFLLFPGTGAAAEAKLVKKEEGHWAVVRTIDILVDGKKVPLGIALNLIGVSSGA